jgi:hypothetical protein
VVEITDNDDDSEFKAEEEKSESDSELGIEEETNEKIADIENKTQFKVDDIVKMRDAKLHKWKYGIVTSTDPLLIGSIDGGTGYSWQEVQTTRKKKKKKETKINKEYKKKKSQNFHYRKKCLMIVKYS